MEAIIPAAGLGSRLKHHTREKSKCLLEVGRSTIFERMVDLILAAGVEKIHVVVGHAAPEVVATVRDPRVRYILNPRYATSNIVVSMALVLPFVKGDFFVLPCDLLFDPSVLDKFLARREDVVMAVDRSMPYSEAATKVTLRGDRVIRTGKDIPVAETDGETSGMYAYYGGAAAKFREAVFSHVKAGRQQLFNCDVIDSMIRAKDAPVFMADITGLKWCEVDDEHDLLRARRMFAEPESAAAAF